MKESVRRGSGMEARLSAGLCSTGLAQHGFNNTAWDQWGPEVVGDLTLNLLRRTL